MGFIPAGALNYLQEQERIKAEQQRQEALAKEQEAKKQAELAKKQEILARLLAQCSPPPRTELQACTRIISSLESLQANLAKAKAHNTQAQAKI